MEGRKIWLTLTPNTKIGIESDVAVKMTERDFAKLYREHVAGASRGDAAKWAGKQVRARALSTELVNEAVGKAVDIVTKYVRGETDEPAEQNAASPVEEPVGGSTFTVTASPNGFDFEASWLIHRFEDDQPLVAIEDVVRFVAMWPRSREDARDYLYELLDRALQTTPPEDIAFSWKPDEEQPSA